MTFLGFLLDQSGSSLVPRWVRLSFRVLVAIFFAVFPLWYNTDSFTDLGIHTAVLAGLVIAETIGKYGTKGNEVVHFVEEGSRDSMGDDPLVPDGPHGHFKRGRKALEKIGVDCVRKRRGGCWGYEWLRKCQGYTCSTRST